MSERIDKLIELRKANEELAYYSRIRKAADLLIEHFDQNGQIVSHQDLTFVAEARPHIYDIAGEKMLGEFGIRVVTYGQSQHLFMLAPNVLGEV